MNCQEARLFIEDALDKSLSGGVKRRLDLHLQHCAECRAFFEAEKAEFVRWYAAVNNASEHAHSLPSDFADRLVAAVTAPRPMPFFLRMPRWALVAASLAVMAMGTLFAAVVVEKVISSFAEEPATVEDVPATTPVESETPQSAPFNFTAGNAYAFQSPFDEYTQSESGEIADVISTNTHTTQTDAEPASEIENKEGNGNMNMNKLIAVAAVAVSAALPSWAANGTWVGGTSTDLCEPLNWSGGEVPNGGIATISVASATTLTCSGEFSPSAIEFGADSALVTISGGGGCITNILAITNNVAQHHVFNVPVTFAEGVVADISVTDEKYMNFPGGMTAYTIATKGERANNTDVYAYAVYSGKITLLKEYEDWDSTYTADLSKKDLIFLRSGSVLTLPGAENSGQTNFQIDNGALLIVNGDFRLTRADYNRRNCMVFQNRNTGEVRVTGKVITSNACHAAPFCSGGYTTGKYTIGGLENGTSYYFMLNGCAEGLNGTYNTQSNAGCNWYVGRYGLTGTAQFHTNLGPPSKLTTAANIYATDDFNVEARISLGSNTAVYFYTTDPNSEVGRTVMVNGVILGSGALRVSGKGEFLINSVSTFSGGLAVNNSATLAVNAGKKPGNGAVALNDTSTLKVAQSGTVTLGGNLTIANGAALAFNFTDRTTTPVLALASGKTVTASGTVKVKVSKSEDMKYPTTASGLIRRQLTSGFGLAANTPLQLVDKPEWVQGVAIVDGNIVLTLKKRGFVVIVK